MESVDKWVLIVIGVVIGIVVLWLILEPVFGLLGLFFKSGKRDR